MLKFPDGERFLLYSTVSKGQRRAAKFNYFFKIILPKSSWKLENAKDV